MFSFFTLPYPVKLAPNLSRSINIKVYFRYRFRFLLFSFVLGPRTISFSVRIVYISNTQMQIANRKPIK